MQRLFLDTIVWSYKISIMKYSLYLTLTCLSVAVTVLLFCGCEVDSASSDIYISPSSAVLRKHESVTLTAYDGYYYEWSVSEETWGVLDTHRGTVVTYTSLYEPAADTPAVQTITVTSRVYPNQTSDNSSVTNGGATVETAEAYITHLPSESDGTNKVSSI